MGGYVGIIDGCPPFGLSELDIQKIRSPKTRKQVYQLKKRRRSCEDLFWCF